MDIDFDRLLDEAGKEAAQNSGIKRTAFKGKGKAALSVAAVGTIVGGAVAGFSALKKMEAREESTGNLTNPNDSSIASGISNYRYGRHLG